MKPEFLALIFASLARLIKVVVNAVILSQAEPPKTDSQSKIPEMAFGHFGAGKTEKGNLVQSQVKNGIRNFSRELAVCVKGHLQF